MQKKMTIKVEDKNFQTMLICAARYACGRCTYMPGIVIDFITPLIPHLDNNTLYVFDQDLTDQKYMGGYGDPKIDEPGWLRFHEKVREERTKRGEQLYRSWREDYEQ